jgi:hypothetical protein
MAYRLPVVTPGRASGESVGCFTGVSPNVSSLEPNIPNQSAEGDSDYRQNGEDPQDREDNHEYANEPLCQDIEGSSGSIVDRSSGETVIESSPRSLGPALRIRSSSPLDPEEVTR